MIALGGKMMEPYFDQETKTANMKATIHAALITSAAEESPKSTATPATEDIPASKINRSDNGGMAISNASTRRFRFLRATAW